MTPDPRAIDVLVVGLGFAGATVARVLADDGFRVLAIDRRDHIGGNAFDGYDESGVLVHRYGPHSFHTRSDRVFDFLSRFTRWNGYVHRVLADVDGMLVPFPINQTTINRLYGLSLDEDGIREHLERVREPRAAVRNSEDVVLGSVGHDLCEKFYRGYTRKHWALDLAELPPGVAARVGARTNGDDRYFQDPHQGIPADGYTRMFERMLDHERIRVETRCEWSAAREVPHRHLVFTGPIDSFFACRFGQLPYRSVRFEHEHIPGIEWAQPVGTVNYPGRFAFTRVSEFKHFTRQEHPGTSILREYPGAGGDPLYPIRRPESEELLGRYDALAAGLRDVTFVGRLAQYRYLDMDQVVEAALAAADKIARQLRPA